MKTPLASNGDLHVVHCTECGFSHLDPKPDKLSLLEFYRDEFWQEEKPGCVNNISAQLAWWHRLWGMLLDSADDVAHGRSVIDFGAGYGHFVHFAKAYGRAAYGVEPNEEARAYAENELGVEMLDLSVEELPAGIVADVASVQWVLEHLLDPEGFLADLAFRTDVLILAVPNEFTEAQHKASKVVGCNWWIHKSHINYFTKKTLTNLLAKSGWEPAYWFGTHPMEHFVLDGWNYVNDPTQGPGLHKTVRDVEMSWPDDYYRRVYTDRGIRGVGRDLIVVAKSAYA